MSEYIHALNTNTQTYSGSVFFLKSTRFSEERKVSEIKDRHKRFTTAFFYTLEKSQGIFPYEAFYTRTIRAMLTSRVV